MPSSKGRSGGGTTLIALDTALSSLGAVRASFACRFGECAADGCAVAAGTLITPSSVRCEVPAAPIAFGTVERSRPLPLRLAPNGQQFTLGPANFTFLSIEPTLMALEPPIGPIRGHTAVHVRGDGLTLGDAPRCRFGVGVEVAASRWREAGADDDAGVVCASPPTALAAEVPLEVTFNGVDWIGNETHGSFTYNPPPCCAFHRALRADDAR